MRLADLLQAPHAVTLSPQAIVAGQQAQVSAAACTWMYAAIVFGKGRFHFVPSLLGDCLA